MNEIHPIVRKTFNKRSRVLPCICDIQECVLFDQDWGNLGRRLENTYVIRAQYIKRNFCILSDEFMVSIKHMVRDRTIRRIVELCSGSGWFSYWLTKYGVPIIASIDNNSWSDRWDERAKMARRKSAINYVREHPEIELFILSWPYMDNVANRVWDAMRDNQYLLYIGESDGGCTANEKFFESVAGCEEEDNWRLRSSFRSFLGIHDSPYLFRKGGAERQGG